MAAIYNIGLLTITLPVAYVIIWAFRKAWNDRKQEISNRERMRNNRQSMRPEKYY